ncbi:hypothetical protein niasHT_000926 [Heterodera trifolii]|uniref:Uncharacterized protein n=1 Tax=Heterodera trifolii TaxID=157864 RepID=A0ABD2LR85_9BILA
MLESDTLAQNQSASVSPGWNDPPPLANPATTTAAAHAGLTNGVANGAGRLHLQRQRRPVDPSVQSAENFVQLRGNTSSAANLQPAQPQQQQQNHHFHHSRSFPQLAAAAVNNGSTPPPPPLAPPMPQRPPTASPLSHAGGAAAIGAHPASAFTPVGASATPSPPMGANSLAHHTQLFYTGGAGLGAVATNAATTPHLPSRQQIVMPSSAAANAQMSHAAAAAANNNHHHQFASHAPPPVPVPPPTNLLANPGAPPPPAPPIQQQQNTAQVLPPSEFNSLSTAHHLQQQQLSLVASPVGPPNLALSPPVEMAHHQQMAPPPTAALGFSAVTSSSIMGGASNGHQATAAAQMLFSPPNIVPLAADQQQLFIAGNNGFVGHGHHNPSLAAMPTHGAGGSLDLNNYKVPVKAAGDVSLNSLQLAAFLTKATLLLQPGPTREGIQLRFNQFGEHVQAGQISEACLKKLNFVVDAIDRHVYDEAWQFFEQMVATFPGDCAIGGWAHGVRLLLQELRKLSTSSASSMSLSSHSVVPPPRSHSAGTRLTH